MKVLHFTTDINSGASIACIRLHRALILDGVYSIVYTQKQIGESEPSKNIWSLNFEKVLNLNNEFNGYLKDKYTFQGNTMFSFPTLYNNSEMLDNLVSGCEIINLHWISSFLSISEIANLTQKNIPIVWTVHDKNIFTGGCHCFHGCDNWRIGCHDCPQLKKDFDKLPSKVFEFKKNNFNLDNITLVVLNNSFRDIALASPIFKNSRIEVIPNSIEIDKFHPHNRSVEQFRRNYKIPDRKKLLFYSASYASTIKGYKEFCETINLLPNRHDYHVILAGHLPPERDLEVSYTYLGYLKESEIIDVYANVDLSIVSSIEDNLPNVCLESLSCGTPVVGFKVGGIPDLIQDNYNGYTVEVGDCKALAEAIETLCEGASLRQNCREFAVTHFAPKVQSNKYKKLYEDLLCTKSHKVKTYTQNIIEYPELDSIRIPVLEEYIIFQKAMLDNFSNKYNSLVKSPLKMLKTLLQSVPLFMFIYRLPMIKYSYRGIRFMVSKLRNKRES